MPDTSRRVDGVGLRSVLRWLLGGALILAGVSHLSTQRTEFQAHVPGWFPIDENVVGTTVAAFRAGTWPTTPANTDG